MLDVGVGIAMGTTGIGGVPGVALMYVGIDQILQGSTNIRCGRASLNLSVIESMVYKVTGNETVSVLLPAAAALGIGLLPRLAPGLFRAAGGAAADSRSVWSSAVGDVSVAGDALPGGAGMVVARRLTATEMAALQLSHGVEFALVYELGAGLNGGGGRYLLFSGTRTTVWFPPSGRFIWISHTHPAGYAQRASINDRLWLKLLQDRGSLQRFSTVVPVDGVPFRFNPFRNRLW